MAQQVIIYSIFDETAKIILAEQKFPSLFCNEVFAWFDNIVWKHDKRAKKFKDTTLAGYHYDSGDEFIIELR